MHNKCMGLCGNLAKASTKQSMFDKLTGKDDKFVINLACEQALLKESLLAGYML